ncbi:MAG TPA: TetR/AcrR family transcriptional regulator C-terminal domain-containing protein [Acidimicrobiales bacterium]
MALTRDDVVRAAVELLDEQGLDGVTLRALGDRLGVAAPTLYWHVRNKRHLLDLVAEAIVREGVADVRPEPAPGEPWWEWVAERARAVRGALLRHRDGARLVAGNRPTPESAVHIDRMLAVLVEAGLSPAEALRFWLVLTAYITGDALEAQSDAAREPLPDEEAAALRAAFSSPERPTLAAAMEAAGPDDERFEEGLALMIAGLRARLAARAEARDAEALGPLLLPPESAPAKP